MALSANIEFIDRELEKVSYQKEMKVSAAETIYKGALVFSDGGYIAPQSAISDVAVGVAVEEKDNSAGADGDLEVSVLIGGKIWLAHSGAAQTDIGEKFEASDDNTIANVTTGESLGTCIDWKDGYLLIDMNRL